MVDGREKRENRMSRKILAALLALIMAFGLASAAVSAAPRHKYPVYTCLGDSVSTGFGLPYYNKYGKMYIPFTKVEGAYPTLVARGVGAKTFYPLSIPGYRSADIRYLLDDSRKPDWVLKDGSALMSGGTISEENLNRWRPMYQEDVKKADLITLDIGYNDIWLPTISCIYDIAADGRYDGTMDALIAQLKTNDIDALSDVDVRKAVINNAISYLNAWVRHPLKWAYYMAQWTSAVRKWMFDYSLNYKAIVDRIYELNPNATVVLVGMYNPFNGWDVIGDDNALQKALQPYINTFNHEKQVCADRYPGKAVYVDVTGTELISNKTTLPLLENVRYDDSGFNPHPSAEGHRYIAGKILSALEE